MNEVAPTVRECASNVDVGVRVALSRALALPRERGISADIMESISNSLSDMASATSL